MTTAETLDKPIRVAITYRVCQHWRTNAFRRLHARPDIDVTVLHGSDVPGTRVTNGKNLDGFNHVQMFTLKKRGVDLVFHPFIFFHLWRLRPDVILAEGGSNVFSNIPAYFYAWLTRTPTIWWTLGAMPGQTYEGLVRKTYRRVVVGLERASTVLLGYSSLALEYFKQMGFPEQRCFRAVNCIDTDRILEGADAARENASRLRAELGLTGKKVVLFVGILIASKKIDRLLRSFAEVSKNVADAKLVIVGDGDDRDRLEQIASELGIDADTHFAGRVVDGVQDYYQLGDVFVLPGLGGLAVSEALANSLPIICGVGDGCEVDLVLNGENGYRIDSDDDDEVEAFIADRLVEILGDDDKRARMSQAAIDTIKNKWNVHSYIEGVVAAIKYAVAAKN